MHHYDHPSHEHHRILCFYSLPGSHSVSTLDIRLTTLVSQHAITFPQIETFLLRRSRVACKELMKLRRLRKHIKLTRHRSLPENTKGSISPCPEISTIAVMLAEESNLANPQDNYSKTSILSVSEEFRGDVNKLPNKDGENINSWMK